MLEFINTYFRLLMLPNKWVPVPLSKNLVNYSLWFLVPDSKICLQLFLAFVRTGNSAALWYCFQKKCLNHQMFYKLNKTSITTISNLPSTPQLIWISLVFFLSLYEIKLLKMKNIPNLKKLTSIWRVSEPLTKWCSLLPWRHWGQIKSYA